MALIAHRRILATILACLVLGCSEDSTQPVPTRTIQEDVYVTSQEELDALRDVRRIEGVLAIRGEDIQSLASLSYLEYAKELTIHDCGRLISLGSLPSLRAVDELTIESNPELTDLTGLEALASARRVWIHENGSLRSIAGLSGLSRVTDYFGMLDNPGLESLSGLGSLREVSTLAISGSPELTSFEGIGGIQSAYSIRINGAQISDMGGFPQLEALGSLWLVALPAFDADEGSLPLQSVETLHLRGLPKLTSLATFSSLRRIGELYFSGNTGLTTFESLTALEECPTLRLTGDDFAVDWSNPGLPLIRSVFLNRIQAEAVPSLSFASTVDSIEIRESSQLRDLSHLASAETIGSLRILTCEALMSPSSLSGVPITGEILVYDCASIVDLAGLEGAIELTGKLRLMQNRRLSSLAGLRNLTQVGDEVRIYDNQVLCQSLVTQFLDGVITLGETRAESNANCAH